MEYMEMGGREQEFAPSKLGSEIWQISELGALLCIKFPQG